MDYSSLIPNFQSTIPKFLDAKNRFAVIGDFENPKSRAYEVFHSMKDKGYTVTLVCPQGASGPHITCVESLAHVKEKPDVVTIATPPGETLRVVQECLKHDFGNVWIETGSESDEAIKFCKSYYITVVYFHSIIQELVRPGAARDLPKRWDV